MHYIAVAVFWVLPFAVSPYYVKVGILSDDPDTDKIKKVWSVAQNYSTMMSLDPTVQRDQWWSIVDAPVLSRSVCSLVRIGVDALVFLGAPKWNTFVSAYSDQLGLPLISAVDNNEQLGKYQVNMMPDTSEAAMEFMRHFGWSKFVFIYDSDNGPNQLQKIFRLAFSHDFMPKVETFWKTSDADQAFRYIQDSLQPYINRHIVLATSEAFADQLSSKLALGRNYHILLLTPVGTVQRASTKGFYKLTKFSAVDAQDEILKTLDNRLKTIPSLSATRGRRRKDIPDLIILHYDSSSFLNTMFNKVARDKPEALKPQNHLDCLELNNSISDSVNYLKQVYVEHGATGKIKFDETGFRVDYKLNIIQTTPFDVQKIGAWSDRLGLELAPEFARDTDTPTFEAQKMSNIIRVVSILNPPYLYLSEDGKLSGYAKDLMDALCDEIKHSCTLSLVEDSRYGTMIGTRWNGMIGTLIDNRADLAIADLTKTKQRGQVVDFSKDFMTVGLNILIKKSKFEMDVSSFGPFTFITVWSVGTWMIILMAILIYSSAGYAISRFIGLPDRVRALESKNTDNLSPCGSVWFTIGSLFCRDTGIYPRNITHRLWTLLWWIFCTFICLLYVVMLTSALIRSRSTITTTYSGKTSQQLMKQLLDTGVPDIGVVNSGSTMHFFLNSDVGMYRQFGQYLQENPGVRVPGTLAGVMKIRDSDGKFAMITESSTSHYITESQPCDMLATSGYLNTRTYAVALQKNSTLKEIVNHGILSLMESGTLRQLYEKWWHNGSTNCEDPNLDILPKIYSRSLTLYEVSGLFYLLIGLIFLSIIIAVIEYYIRTKNMRMEQ